jgi:hypothetical protein
MHENVDFDRWLGEIIDTKIKGRIGNKKKLKLAAVRQKNQRFIERLVQKMQALIYKEPASISRD